jgi:hypothetical protein
MNFERWIAFSRRVYARMLHLYPFEHRNEYGPSMLQVFTDQCRAAWGVRRGVGLVGLWLRTLVDLGVSVLREQLASPQASSGLLEAVPNAPLPWKGVALVLVPGLIFFISQIGQLTGQDWFFLMVYRAGYFLILPVLLVWAWKGKFPIWGLIPLGLLFNTVWWFGFRLQNQMLDRSNPVWSWLMDRVQKDQTRLGIVMVAGLLGLMILLVGLRARRQSFSHRAWILMGIYSLLTVVELVTSYQRYIHIFSLRGFLIGFAPSDFYECVGFLLLILLGTLLARRHGRLAVLLPLGYLLPTILYGRYINSLWGNPVYLIWISATVLVYRLLVALVAPVWILRSASEQTQARASWITLSILIVIQAAMNIGVMLMLNGATRRGLALPDYYSSVSAQLFAVIGIALALALYQEVDSALPAPPQDMRTAGSRLG